MLNSNKDESKRSARVIIKFLAQKRNSPAEILGKLREKFNQKTFLWARLLFCYKTFSEGRERVL